MNERELEIHHLEMVIESVRLDSPVDAELLQGLQERVGNLRITMGYEELSLEGKSLYMMLKKLYGKDALRFLRRLDAYVDARIAAALAASADEQGEQP